MSSSYESESYLASSDPSSTSDSYSSKKSEYSRSETDSAKILAEEKQKQQEIEEEKQVAEDPKPVHSAKEEDPKPEEKKEKIESPKEEPKKVEEKKPEPPAKKEEPKEEEKKPEPEKPKEAPKKEEKPQQPKKEEPKPAAQPAPQNIPENSTYVPPVDYTVGDELEFTMPLINVTEIKPTTCETDKWTLDSKISAYAQKNFSEKIILGIENKENIFATPTTVDYYNLPSFQKSQTVKFYRENYQDMKVAQPTDQTRENTASRDIIYQTELPAVENPTENTDINLFLAEQYFSVSGKPDNVIPLPEIVEPKRSDLSFLQIEIESFTTSISKPVEPITMGAYLFKSGRVISDRWNFSTEEYLQLYKSNGIDFKSRTKAAFELGDMKFLKLNEKIKSEEEYLIIEFFRPLLVDNGNLVNKYYLNPSESNKSKAMDCIKTSFPRTKHITTTFAYTFVSVKDLLAKPSLTIQAPIICNGPPLKLGLSKFLEKPKLVKSGVLPFKLTLKAQKTTAPTIRKLQDDGYEVVSSLIANANTLAFHFRNQLTFGVRETAFKPPKGIKARNVFARITMVPGKENDKKPIKLLHSNIDGKYVDSVVTEAVYHNESPEFGDTFVCDLPNPLPKELGFNVEFYHGVAQASDIPMTQIGRAYVKVYDEKGLFTQRKVTAPIQYVNHPTPKEVDPKNCMTFFMVPRSHFLSEHPDLQHFFNVAHKYVSLDPDALQKVDKMTINEYFVPILENVTYLASYQPKRAIHCFLILANKIDRAVEKGEGEKRFSWYAKTASFRSNEFLSEMLHVSLMSGYNAYLENMAVPDAEKVPEDGAIIRLIFDLIVKSIMLTKDRKFMNAFEEFAAGWAKYSYKLTTEKADNRNKHFVTFVHKLFDIGAPSAVYEAIKAFFDNMPKNENSSGIFMNFLNQVLTPKVFYSLSVYHDGFVNVICDVMKRATAESEKAIYQTVFRTLVFCVDGHKKSMKTDLADSYAARLNDLTPLGSFPCARSDEISAIIIWFSLVLTYISKEAFLAAFKKYDHEAFFKSVNFILTKVRYTGKDPKCTDKKVIRQKELAYAIHFGVLWILELMGDFQDEKDLVLVTDLYYHMFCANKNIDIIKPLIKQFTKLVEKNTEFMMYRCQPAFPRFVAKILTLNPIAPDESYAFLVMLFTEDEKVSEKFSKKGKNNNRSMAICFRALGAITPQQRAQLKIPNDRTPLMKPLYQGFNNIIEAEKRLVTETVDEIHAELIYTKVFNLISSPDAALCELNELAAFFNQKGKYEEEIQALLLQAAIILEYSTLLGKMKFIWDPDLRYHPGQVFNKLCPAANVANCPMRLIEDPPNVPSFCDSSIFSERSFTDILHTILQKCQAVELYEIGYALIDVFWPLLEHHRMFGALCTFFRTQRDICQKIEEYPQDVIRNFGKYYYVTFINKIFGTDSGLSYIFKETNESTVESFGKRLVECFEKVHGEGRVEIIQQNGRIDPRTLPGDKGFIQIQEVNPHFTRKEMAERLSEFERQHDIEKFAQDEIFTKGVEIEDAQYSDWWIRRQIFKMTRPLPSCYLRTVVLKKDVDEVEYPPIRVAYRNLTKLVAEMRNAIEVNDCAVLQERMKRSMLDTEYQTPLKIAKIFLLEKNPQEAKYNKKLSAAEAEFLQVTKKGLLVHAEWCKQYPSFVPVQNELESSYQIISDLITKIIQE